jgi:hypothetical protein
MAEKNFKITGGLALGDYALTANGLSLLWDSNALASQAYVDTAVSGVTVNTNAIAESLASSSLYVLGGDNLNVNTNAIVGDIDGSGLYVDGVTLAVNTNAIATKEYVDSVVQGLDVKASVRVASTENIDLTVTPPDTIDNISLSVGDRVLLKNQTSSDDNGIYVYSGGFQEGYSLVRSEDADNPGVNLTSGAFTFVESGTVNAGKGFVASIAAGTVDITWSQFSEAGALTAGSGISIDGGAITVNVNAIAGSGLVGGAVALSVNPGSGIYIDDDAVVVNVNAIAGSGLVGDFGALSVNAGSGIFIDNDAVTVNTNAIAGSLASTTLWVSDSDNLNVNVNAIAGVGLVGGNNLSLNQYAAGVRYDGTSDSGGNASVTTDTFYATHDVSDTYLIVTTVPENSAFTLDVFMFDGTNTRKSTISGLADASGSVEYTEYAIVDSATPMTAPDILIEYSMLATSYVVQCKATLPVDSDLEVVIDSKIMNRL